ncbi:hypothetical protein K503DRAFT_696057 [Rhizopogon vinicolor AM-OR11-026]|uniref:G domain-containing protein n=1 Tax=Rhizopogon vinicolor AM-OR11-026 TaxID=1314800 RepID=A0A1B7MTK5_9AGAM|nr:hypothetical protein K503DRAFT_696057 [Rhizopogon vinicolor AM-OR11-026]
MSTKNVVLFGETGAGKSSVVNLMAGEEKAATSPDMQRCTMTWKEYPIAFDGYEYRVFDTIGLQDPHLGVDDYLDAIVNARNLIMKLDDEGGIDLLLFCVRAGSKGLTTVQNNYRLFHEWLCEKKVPIVLVLTGLEGDNNMEDWWIGHKDVFDKYEISIDDHVCITAANKLDGSHQHLYEESRRLVRKLVKEHTHDRPEDGWKGGEGWFRRFTRKLRQLPVGNFTLKKKDVETILTQRCGMPREAAVELAKQVREGSHRGSNSST